MLHEAYLTRDAARQIDQRAIDQYGMTGLVLMENAGRGCADLIERLGIHGPIVVCCGKGNNAGDGFVIARHLDLRGHAVKVLLWSKPERLQGDAAHNFQIIQRAQLSIVQCADRPTGDWLAEELNGADWIVDALLGTGARGEPQPPLDAVLEVLNAHAAKKFAVDLPSGLDCDSGAPASCTFRADHTATFVAPKVGFRADQAKHYLGTVHVLDIGAPRKLVQSVLSAENPAGGTGR